MVGRRWAALLVLAAVFAVHGVQCTSLAVDSAAHAHGPAHAAPLVLTPSATADDHGGGIAASAPQHTVSLLPAAAGAATAVVGAGHDTSPPGSAGHLWTLCLAVLAAGLAVLLAVLAARLVPLARRLALRAPVRGPGWVAPPRPPDLFALCLLRT